jgi:hypothetical protein
MVSTFTPNINLEEPARGDDVGTWDVPVNNNMSVVDLVAGGIVTIALNNSPIVLNATQYKPSNITFSSTLTGSVAITFPTSFVKPYTIGNLCTGSSAFTITLGTTAAGGQVICCPPGEFIDIFNDGTNLKYRNLGRVGSYWDYAGSSVPAWVSGCSVPPYLNCNAGTFSSATYPQLAVILAGNTLPDSRGSARFALDQGVGRISSAATGFSGSSVGSLGGGQATTLSSLNMPPIPITDPGHSHVYSGPVLSPGAGPSGTVVGTFTPTNTAVSATGITAGSSSPTAFTNLPPAYIGGITMIRAA